MSDLKKSSQDLNELTNEIENIENQVCSEIEVLEARRCDIEELSNKLSSVSEHLSGIEGESLEIAQQEINQKIEQKANEAEQSETKLKELSGELKEKQDQIEGEIEEYGQALEEINTAEQETDVDLTASRDSINQDRAELLQTSGQIEDILMKIDDALSGQSSQKKTSSLIEKGKQLFKDTKKNTEEFREKVNAVVALGGILMSPVASSSISNYLDFSKGFHNKNIEIIKRPEQDSRLKPTIRDYTTFEKERIKENNRKRRKKIDASIRATNNSSGSSN